MLVSSITLGQAIELGLPIDCDVGRNCVIQQYVDHDLSSKARDYQCGTLTSDGHNGTDFRLPNLAARRAGVSVLAAADGQRDWAAVNQFRSVRQMSECHNGNRVISATNHDPLIIESRSCA